MAFVQRHDGGVEPLRQHDLLPDATYTEGITTLERGDTLVIHSDGLPVARPDLQLDSVGVVEQLGELKGTQAKLKALVGLIGQVDSRPNYFTVMLVRRQNELPPDTDESLSRGSSSR